MKLLTSQKNELFRRVVNHGFKINQFSYAIAPDNRHGYDEMVRIVYEQNPEYYFLIGDNPYGEVLINYSPGETSAIKTDISNQWGLTSHLFDMWLHWLKREISQEDEWENAIRIAQNVGFTVVADVTYFTSNEIKLLGKKMEYMKTAVRNLSIPNEQIEIINNKLDEILLKANNSTKFDWQSFLVGTIMTIIVALSITSDVQIEFWKLIKHFFSDMPLLR